MGWFDRFKQAGELLGTLERIVEGARDLAHAKELLHKAAERGDLDVALSHVLRGQARASNYERTGR